MVQMENINEYGLNLRDCTHESVLLNVGQTAAECSTFILVNKAGARCLLKLLLRQCS